MSNGYVYVGPLPSFGSSQTMTMANTTSQYAPYVGARLANQYEIEQGNEETLGGALLGGSVFMGAFQLPKVIHPIRTINAVKEANEVIKGVREAEQFKALSNVDKNKAYSTMFEIGRKSGKINAEALAKAGRTQEEIQEITKLYNEAKQGYQTALKAGDKVAAEECAARMNAIIDSGKKQGIVGRCMSKVWHPTKTMPPKFNPVATVKDAATTAGAKAATEAGAAVKATAEATTKTAKAVNWGKQALKSGGAKPMAVLSGAIEGLTEVLPAFTQGGASEGLKQTAKSAVTVAGDVAGWCVGAKAGAAVGAAIGSFIPVPVAGTAVGAAIGGVCGFLGGIAGSYFMRKATKAVIGESFSEKQAKKEKQQQAVMQATMQAQATKEEPITFKGQTTNVNPYSSNPFAQQNLDMLGLNSISYDLSNPNGLYI